MLIISEEKQELSGTFYIKVVLLNLGNHKGHFLVIGICFLFSWPRYYPQSKFKRRQDFVNFHIQEIIFQDFLNPSWQCQLSIYFRLHILQSSHIYVVPLPRYQLKNPEYPVENHCKGYLQADLLVGSLWSRGNCRLKGMLDPIKIS